MTPIARKWTIAMALSGATPDDWLTNVQMSGPPVRPGEPVEVVPAGRLEGAVSLLREAHELDGFELPPEWHKRVASFLNGENERT